MLYTAVMKHNAETIEKLVLMQYNTFQLKNKIAMIIISIALIVYGVFTFSTGMITSYLCLFLSIEYHPSILWCEYYVIFAIPSRMC